MVASCSSRTATEQRADLPAGATTPAPFGTQITDDGAAVVVVDVGQIVRTEVATGTALTRTLPAGWTPSGLTSIDGIGGGVGVSATNGGLADEGAYVVDMTTGVSSPIDSTVPGAQQGDGSRNPVLSATARSSRSTATRAEPLLARPGSGWR